MEVALIEDKRMFVPVAEINPRLSIRAVKSFAKFDHKFVVVAFVVVENMVVIYAVPVAFIFFAFTSPVLSVPIFPVTEFKVFIKPVAKAKIFPVIFVTVVEASVDEPDTNIFVPVAEINDTLSMEAFNTFKTLVKKVVEVASVKVAGAFTLNPLEIKTSPLFTFPFLILILSTPFVEKII